jgi:AAA family ATP:ADP antiporter
MSSAPPRYQATVNLVALLLQLFVVGRAIKYLGVRVALLVMPVIAFAGYGLMAFTPILMAIRWAKTAENATDYSLQNTIRQALFLPTTREEKYAAKQAIDGFFVRMGDVVGAGSSSWEPTTTRRRHFALLNWRSSRWIAVALAIGRRYERLVAATP